MNNKTKMALLLLSVLTISAPLQAGTPVWTFTPLTATTISLSPGSTATVQYRVTNQSRKTHTLKMLPISGVTQVTTPGNCPNPFILSPSNPSCTLTLQITGSALDADIHGGPKVCQQSPNGNPNPLMCYQPGQNDLLNVTLTQQSFARYAYITNYVNNDVSQCAINSATGELFSCAITLNGFNGPYGVTISNNYAYISDFNNNAISQCAVNLSTGELSNCALTGNGLSGPAAIAFNNGFAYISNGAGNTVSQCTVDPSTGALVGCITAINGIFSPLGGIAINNGYAYIASQLLIEKCTIHPITGALSNCAATGNGFNSPFGIAIQNGFAYATNYGNDTVSLCTIDPSTGDLLACTTTGSNFFNPNGMGIAYDYAYINNYSNDSVTKCVINPLTGVLSSCSLTGNGFLGPSGSIDFFIQ